MTKEQIQELINAEIYNLLHPNVEIVSLDNPIPRFACAGDAAVDLRASLNRIRTEFFDGAYLQTRADDLHEQLQDAFEQDDRKAVNEIWAQIDASKADGTYNNITAIVIKPGGTCLVPTGLFTAFNENYVLDITPRSGLALKPHITIPNSPGKVDSKYRDEIGVIITNEGRQNFIIRHGDKISQGQFSIKCTPNFIVKKDPSELSGESRGGGFGHTGI